MSWALRIFGVCLIFAILGTHAQNSTYSSAPIPATSSNPPASSQPIASTTLSTIASVSVSSSSGGGKTNETSSSDVTIFHFGEDSLPLILLPQYVYSYSEQCPAYAEFFGQIGIAASMAFSIAGAAYGTARSSVGIANISVFYPEFAIKGFIPVIFAGVNGIYGFIIAVLVMTGMKDGTNYTMTRAMYDLAAGFTMGLSSLGSGISIGIVGDYGVRASAKQPKIFIGVLLVLAFASALALYGLIVAMIFVTKSGGDCPT
jgi:V-type H+-transporting ATPase proteolipid subunit